MKTWLSLLLILLLCRPTQAQQRELAPDFMTLQYAGSIGLASVGLGYEVFRAKTRASLHFGTVPASHGGPLSIITGKFLMVPWVIPAGENFRFNPCDIGVMISHHSGENFKVNVPDYLSGRNYYWWHTALRAHLAVESSVSVRMEQDRFFRKITLYAELNTNDLYIVSFFSNASTLNVRDLVKAGIGTRFRF